MLRFSGFVATLALVAGCAKPPAKPEEQLPPLKLAPLPATYINDADCPGCLEVTLTLRADGSYLVRDQLGESEFYDFGRWRHVDGTLHLEGDRDTRRYSLRALRLAPKVEQLRGPFRLVGVYDGATFKECRTGIGWALAQTRAAENLKGELAKAQGHPVLVSLDAQFEGTPEMLRVLRPATVLDARSCPK